VIIARIVGIGTGTVSEIIKDYNQRNPEFVLLREFVVAVKKREAILRSVHLRSDLSES
jgi:hypothetical protein